MTPPWTKPLSISVLKHTLPPPSQHPHPHPLSSPSFDYKPHFHSPPPVHDVPATPSIIVRVQAAETSIPPNISPTLSHQLHHQQEPPMPRLPRLLQRSSNNSRPHHILRLNRLHPPLPSDLSSFAPPVRSEFLRVSTVAAKKYVTPPDPADDHDHSLFEFPSVILRDTYSSPSPPVQEPRRRNIQYLIQHYNNNQNLDQSSPDPRSPTSSSQSPTSSGESDKHQPQFNIRSVRDIFERHTQRLPEHDASLSSVTDSASPSDASHTRLINQTNIHTNSPPPDNRPRRIAFADLSNTLDLSPCASSTSDSHPDDRHVPVVTPPPHSRSPTLFPSDDIHRPVGRKKSFAIFRSVKRRNSERGRSKSFAHGEKHSSGNVDQTSSRRFTNAERPRKNWVSRHVRAYGGSVRRRFESFRNMISADDY